MKTDPKAKVQRASDKLIADKKSRPLVSRSSGEQATKKRQKPSDMQFTNIIEKIIVKHL